MRWLPLPIPVCDLTLADLSAVAAAFAATDAPVASVLPLADTLEKKPKHERAFLHVAWSVTITAVRRILPELTFTPRSLASDAEELPALRRLMLGCAADRFAETDR